MTEKDPNGLKPNEAGAKLDLGKPKCAQILGMFAHALWEVSKVGTFGAEKYSMGGWQHVEDGENRYANAGMRHFLLDAMGEEIDQDSQLMHLSQEAWNALAKLELHCRELKNGSNETKWIRRSDDIVLEKTEGYKHLGYEKCSCAVCRGDLPNERI